MMSGGFSQHSNEESAVMSGGLGQHRDKEFDMMSGWFGLHRDVESEMMWGMQSKWLAKYKLPWSSPDRTA